MFFSPCEPIVGHTGKFPVKKPAITPMTFPDDSLVQKTSAEKRFATYDFNRILPSYFLNRYFTTDTSQSQLFPTVTFQSQLLFETLLIHTSSIVTFQSHLSTITSQSQLFPTVNFQSQLLFATLLIHTSSIVTSQSHLSITTLQSHLLPTYSFPTRSNSPRNCYYSSPHLLLTRSHPTPPRLALEPLSFFSSEGCGTQTRQDGKRDLGDFPHVGPSSLLQLKSRYL
jgi:hypothetical protein